MSVLVHHWGAIHGPMTWTADRMRVRKGRAMSGLGLSMKFTLQDFPNGDEKISGHNLW